MRPGVSPMTLKQSDRFVNGLVKHSLGWKNWNCKGPTSRPCWYFFYSQGVVHKEFITEGKTVNAEFYKGVMDRLLKPFQWVCPPAFCSQYFFLLHDNAPAHKAACLPILLLVTFWECMTCVWVLRWCFWQYHSKAQLHKSWSWNFLCIHRARNRNVCKINWKLYNF